MPSTEYDAELIERMPPGTPVRHRRHPEFGAGTVADAPVEFDQVPVRWPDQPAVVAYHYPVWLEVQA